MDKSVIKELNAVLKGEHMAVGQYDKFINKVKDKDVKDSFQLIQQEHKQHALELAERIQNLGGRPAKGVGAMNKVGEVMSVIKDMKLKDTNGIIKRASSGENQGIQMVVEIVKGDLDAESKNIVNGIINDDRNHVQMLNGLIDHSGRIQ